MCLKASEQLTSLSKLYILDYLVMFGVSVRLLSMASIVSRKFLNRMSRISSTGAKFSRMWSKERQQRQNPGAANLIMSNFYKRENRLTLEQEHSVGDVKILHVGIVKNLLNITWKDGKRSAFPLIYLRDICPCPKCFHQEFKQRISDVTVTCELNYHSTSANVTKEGAQLDIIWSDEHLSSFDSNWLHDRILQDEQDGRPDGNSVLKEGVITWRSEMSNNIPTLDYHQVMTDDLELLKWLDKLICYGLVVITGAPAKRRLLTSVASRVGYSKSTFYEDPVSIPSSLNTAKLYNTGGGLPFHTDMKYIESAPGAMLLHCINQATTGGESLFIDGFCIANELKLRDPQAFELLTEIYVPNQENDRDCRGEFITQARKPTIMLDFDGTIKSLSFHETSRDLYHCAPLQKTEPFIRAYGKLAKLLKDPTFTVRYKMNPGDIIALNNERVLHARGAYSSAIDNSRLLEGTYFDWDPIYSRIRVLAKKMNVLLRPSF